MFLRHLRLPPWAKLLEFSEVFLILLISKCLFYLPIFSLYMPVTNTLKRTEKTGDSLCALEDHKSWHCLSKLPLFLRMLVTF